jgi:predicted transcriptional regulator
LPAVNLIIVKTALTIIKIRIIMGAMKNIDQEVREFLTETGMSRKEFAEKAGLSSAFVTRLLNGERRNVLLSTAQKIYGVIGKELKICPKN